MDLRQVYTQLINEHNKNCMHKHHLDQPTATKYGVNPSCGDEITLELKIENDTILDASFTGYGCAISQASTDMMIDLIKGKSVEQAKELSSLFKRMIRNELVAEDDIEQLEDATALQDVAHMPARVKCAVLAWHTFEEMINNQE